jgi:hypothetical protein
MTNEEIKFLENIGFKKAMTKQETKHEVTIFVKEMWANGKRWPIYDISVWKTSSGYRYKIGWGNVLIGGANVKATYLMALQQQHDLINAAWQNMTALKDVNNQLMEIEKHESPNS